MFKARIVLRMIYPGPAKESFKKDIMMKIDGRNDTIALRENWQEFFDRGDLQLFNRMQELSSDQQNDYSKRGTKETRHWIERRRS